MKQNASFRDILDEQLRESPVPSGGDWTLSHNDPAHMAYLLGQIGVFRFRKPTPAPRPKSRFSRENAPPPATRRPSGPAHRLSERQNSALMWFKDQGEILEPDFSRTELKSAFRRLARRLHPDMDSGGTEAFLSLKREHRALEEIFTA